jgi:hypothetical protein
MASDYLREIRARQPEARSSSSANAPGVIA